MYRSVSIRRFKANFVLSVFILASSKTVRLFQESQPRPGSRAANRHISYTSLGIVLSLVPEFVGEMYDTEVGLIRIYVALATVHDDESVRDIAKAPLTRFCFLLLLCGFLSCLEWR